MGFNETFDFGDVKVIRDGIAWNSDIDRSVFTNGVNPKVWEDIGATEEDYIVWMRASALPRVRKLWGKIDRELPVGFNLSVTINPQYNVANLGVTKTLVIEELSMLGGSDPAFYRCLLHMSFACFLLALIVFAEYKCGYVEDTHDGQTP